MSASSLDEEATVLRTIRVWLSSTEPFPVPGDELTVYSSRNCLVKALRHNYKLNVDYIIHKDTTSTGGRPRHVLSLSIPCAKEVMMMHSSAFGKRVRRYFILAEEILRRDLLAQPGALQMVLQDHQAYDAGIDEMYAQQQKAESYYQSLLETMYGTDLQCRQCENGVMDISLHDTIIEIKRWTLYKYALGQLLAYREGSEKRLQVIFFGMVPATRVVQRITALFEKYRIYTTYFDSNDELIVANAHYSEPLQAQPQPNRPASPQMLRLTDSPIAAVDSIQAVEADDKVHVTIAKPYANVSLRLSPARDAIPVVDLISIFGIAPGPLWANKLSMNKAFVTEHVAYISRGSGKPTPMIGSRSFIPLLELVAQTSGKVGHLVQPFIRDHLPELLRQLKLSGKGPQPMPPKPRFKAHSYQLFERFLAACSAMSEDKQYGTDMYHLSNAYSAWISQEYSNAARATKVIFEPFVRAHSRYCMNTKQTSQAQGGPGLRGVFLTAKWGPPCDVRQ